MKKNGKKEAAKTERSVDERMQALIDGAEVSDNPVVTYLATALKEAMNERAGLQQQLQQAQQAVAQMQNKLVQLAGVIQKAATDLRKELQPSEVASNVEETAEEEAAPEQKEEAA